jgi:hypothetical protein
VNSIADTLAQAPRPTRQISFAAGQADTPPLGRGAIALRVGIAAAAIFLAVAAQLSTREFDAGWGVVGIAFCVMVVAALALSLRSIGPVGTGIAHAWRQMAERRARHRADLRFMARAQHDPRLMAEIQVAISRGEEAGELSATAVELVEEAARRQRRSQLAR